MIDKALVLSLAVNNIEQILELGKNGVNAINTLLAVNKLKQKNENINKDIKEYYLQIGQEVYKKNGECSPIVEEKIEKINQLKVQIDKNLEEIKNIEQKAKDDGVSEHDFKVVKDVYNQLSEANKENDVSSKKTKKAVQKVSTKQSSKMKAKKN